MGHVGKRKRKRKKKKGEEEGCGVGGKRRYGKQEGRQDEK